MKKYICNPLNLEYRYQIKQTVMCEAGVFREAADPTMLLFNDTYYMFASMSGGFWYSDDLYDWNFKETPELPIFDYAPDVCAVNGKVIFSASRAGEPCTFYVSANPLTEPFAAVSTPFQFWDPHTFQDDDGRVYFYWGCTNQEPIWGLEMNPETFLPIGEKVAIIGENEAAHGWERGGENNRLAPPKTEMDKKIREHLGTKPFIEGAFMNKHNGKYYMQYAAPATECNVYADGVYVGDSPLGPFTYQAHNPFSYRPGGFITGAGHGSTFRDKSGSWWHASTMRISVNEGFERRIGLFPCDFDTNGIMWCNQHFADYPYALPEGVRRDIDRTAPDWALLSYNKRVSASSYQTDYEPGNGANEDIRTWWAADETDKDAGYQMDLGSICDVNAVQLNFADHKLPLPEGWQDNAHSTMMEKRVILTKPQRTVFLLEGSADGETWQTLKDRRGGETDYTHDFICFDAPLKLRYLRVSYMSLAMNGVPAISGLRVFGKGNGSAPEAVTSIKAIRTEEGLDAKLCWDSISGADGYNVRFGTAEDKLYNSWQVFGKNELILSALNKDSGYFIAVDSFNENGVTEGKINFIK